jgi:hypothetical protein
LHGTIEVDVLARIGMVDDYVARGARCVRFQMLDKATFAEGVKAFGDGSGVD